MSKSVLIIDKPENCEDCDLFEANLMTHFVPYCYKENRVTKWKGRPDWCPLISEPKRLITIDSTTGYDVISWNRGWNACLDALEGKENE